MGSSKDTPHTAISNPQKMVILIKPLKFRAVYDTMRDTANVNLQITKLSPKAAPKKKKKPHLGVSS